MTRRPRESTDVLYAEMTGQHRRLEPGELKRPLPPFVPPSKADAQAIPKLEFEPPRVRPWWHRVMPGRRG